MSLGLNLTKWWYRLANRLHSSLIRGGFKRWGAGSTISYPFRSSGERWIAIGSRVTLGSHCWLQVLPEGRKGDAAVIRIGDGTSVVGGCTISAAAGVEIGRKVLIAGRVYIADHRHAFEDTGKPIMDQGVTDVRPVKVGDGAWLGQNVVVCPGVTIGRNAVVGANSVVRKDVPDFAVVAGVPARLIRMIGEGEGGAAE